MSDRNYGALRDAEKVVTLIDRLIGAGKPIAFDIEAGYRGADKAGVALQQFHPDYFVVGISFTNSTEWARYVPLAHDNGGNVDDVVVVARALWRMLNTGLGVAHNAAYELKGMSRFFRETLWNDPEFGEAVRDSRGMFPILSDTILEVWLAAEYDPLRVGKDLKSVSLAAFGLQMSKFESLFPLEDTDMGPAMKRGKIRFARFNTRNAFHPAIISYACEDSVAALMIHQKHHAALKDSRVYRMEMALLPVLVEMEMGPVDDRGVAQGNMLFNWPLIHSKADEVENFRQRFEEEILGELSERLGRLVNINLGSPKQLADILYEPAPNGLGLKATVFSDKTNAPSTSDKALRVVAKTDPTVAKLLQYRSVAKLNAAYLRKFEAELDYSGTGVVFPNHNQAGALTGRMSVDQVSYQQWPQPYHFKLKDGTRLDFYFRELFISPPEFRIVGFDYSNIEMRVAGALSGERGIVNAFNTGQDLHKATASATFQVPFEEVTKNQRQAAKTLNFATLYGSGPSNIADMMTAQGVPTTKDEAIELLRAYHKGYPALSNWMNVQTVKAREQKYVETHFGRKFTVWELYSNLAGIRAKGERLAVNAPIQGTAADILKLAMVRANKAIRAAGLRDKIRMVLTVHDALEFYVHESIPTQEVIDLIEPCVNFPVPGFPLEIRSDWHEGPTWGSVAEVKLDKDKQITGFSIEDDERVFDTLEEALAARAEKTHAADLLQPVDSLQDGEVVVDDPEESDNDKIDEEPPWWKPAERQIVVVTLSDMPTSSGWKAFQEFASKRPGEDTLRVDTPNGSVTLDHGVRVYPNDQGEISMLLGGAALNFEPADVAADLVLDGEEL